ncbi:DNA polymerase II large subunit [Candidatus Pacearchaeota archaeon]|nr:DNA polymerase II large subunit [Candidatus Pacearchaeota archaeon]
MKTQEYFKKIEKDVREIYEVVGAARAKGLDPVNEVEIPLAMTMAEKVVGLISTIYPQMMNSGIAKRILELEKEYGKLDTTVTFKIAEEVAKQKFCKFESLLQAIEAGVRIGFAYSTLGVVSSPIEGFTELKLGKTRDEKDYFIACFSGPIRSAGTTASCVVLMLIDYLREIFGYAKYDSTEEEVKRTVSELTDFHERITNLQYMPTEEEIIFLAKNIPIQVAGDASEKLEVSNYKNLERVDTNFLRSGFCLILAEGLAQKAAKGFRLLKAIKANGIKSTGFDFLEEYIKIHEKRDTGKTDDSPTYIKDLVAGRPVFGHPSRSGALRFRYGRGRVSGFSASSLHPATMAITDDFIAIGTQLKIEKPTKGTVATVCDCIEGPIVKLVNGSVKKIKTKEEAKKVYSDVEEIIYLGDILFPFSDLANRNSNLIKPGYVEEWWGLDLREKNFELEKEINYFNVDFENAVELSKKYNIPLHPNFIFYWTEISKEQFLGLIDWLKHSRVSGKIIFPYNPAEQEKFELGKRCLELLGFEHDVTIENVVVNEENSKALFANLGIDLNILGKEEFLLYDVFDVDKFDLDKSVLETVNSVSYFEIKDKAGDFIGTRMGRPEKAKLRKLTGSPNVLFPVGKEGGRLRSVQAACEEGRVRSAFPINYCDNCKKETIYSVCEDCGGKCRKMFYFFETKEKSFNKIEEGLEREGMPYCNQDLDINHYFEKAREKIGFDKKDVPLLIKGVRGTSSAGHMMENLSKGILRAKHGLQVNKDGTIRFDATELPLVSFKPKEVFVSIEKLKELGYDQDVFGKELIDENQILELMPHDVLIPSSPESPDEKGEDVFMNICNFVDELLVKFYGLKPFYNLKKKEDLIGHFGVCMAPHNCAGVVCRFIGFSKTLGLFASPYMHAAIRRDCDGDEAAIMLLGDVLLNFSRKFLPSHRGGTQDAPLVLNAKIDAGEVDDQILDFEFVNEYPLELYRLAEQRKHSSEVKVNTVKDILKQGKDPFVNIGFTHDTSDFNEGVLCSSYKLLATMQEKVQHQMELVERIRAVDTSDTARLILERHFIRDMRGNLRKFSMQGFRCVACNEIMRRPPLTGVCPKCRGKIIFTIHEGGIKKYLEPALDLAKKYNLSPYIKQNLELIKRYIDSIFGKELEKQEKLGEWF